MNANRRDFIGGLGALAATGFSGCRLMESCGCGDSVYDGVQIGAITYSFYRMPIGPGSTLLYLRKAGLTHTELMGYDLEVEAGAPVWRCPWDQDQAAQAKQQAWRDKVDVRVFEDVRVKYADAGVGIHILKPSVDLTGAPDQSDAMLDYWFKAAKAVGARCMTREIPDPANLAKAEAGLKRIARFCEKYDMLLAFHNHEQIGATTYDGPLLGWSDRFRINFDIGHYVAANDDDPLAFVRKYHDRIFSIHIKDRTTKTHGKLTTVFGEGDAPLAELFELMQKEDWSFPCDIEMEYDIPVGSDAVGEVDRSRRYCRSIID